MPHPHCPRGAQLYMYNIKWKKNEVKAIKKEEEMFQVKYAALWLRCDSVQWQYSDPVTDWLLGENWYFVEETCKLCCFLLWLLLFCQHWLHFSRWWKCCWCHLTCWLLVCLTSVEVFFGAVWLADCVWPVLAWPLERSECVWPVLTWSLEQFDRLCVTNVGLVFGMV